MSAFGLYDWTIFTRFCISGTRLRVLGFWTVLGAWSSEARRRSESGPSGRPSLWGVASSALLAALISVSLCLQFRAVRRLLFSIVNDIAWWKGCQFWVMSFE